MFVSATLILKGYQNIPQKQILFPRSNEPSASLLAFGDCREGQIPRPLRRGYLTEIPVKLW